MRAHQWAWLLCLIALSHLGAMSWSPPYTLSLPSSATETDPQVAADGNGDFIAIWVLCGGANYTIQSSSKERGGTWTASQNASSTDSDEKVLPQIVLDSSGNAAAVWASSNPDVCINLATKLAGGSWVVSSTTLETEDWPTPRIVVGGNGDVIAVWWIFDGENYSIQSATKLFGQGWQLIETVSSSTSEMVSPAIAVDDHGNATVVWISSDGTNASIQSSTKAYGGSWTAPNTVSLVDQQIKISPEIAVDGGGNATAIWECKDAINVYVQSSQRPYGGSWQLTPDTLSVSLNTDLLIGGPQIVVTGGGDATAIWSSFDGINAFIQSSAKSHGGSWQLTPDTLSLLPGIAVGPKIAVDDRGNATAIWDLSRIDGAIIQASTRPAGGAWQSVPDNLLTEAVAWKGVPLACIAIDGFGNAVVVSSTYNGTTSVTQAIEGSAGPAPPENFRGSVKLAHEKNIFVKSSWKKSSSSDVVRYEIFRRNKKIKTIAAKKKRRAFIRLHPHHIPHHISKKYRSYLHHKYKIRAVTASGSASTFSFLVID